MIEQTSKPAVPLEDFASIVGLDHAFERDGKLYLSPANTEEIAAVLRLANSEGIVVHPMGSGTKSAWSDAPRSGIVLRTSRLNAVLDHTWQDMTCSVQTGCTWAAMQLTLAAHGQFVALDPLWPEQATIGGIVATNESGALRLKYGSLRDLVIGMTIVLADGTVARTGGKVVKNVAGYDLHKLMTGAFGTLGFITEINFRLHSLPTARESFTVSSQTVEPLGELMLHLVDSHLSLHALQLRTHEGIFHLDIELASLPQTLDEHRLLLEAIAHEKQLRIVAAAADIWQRRALLFDQQDTFTIKATMLPTEIARFSGVISGLAGSAITQATGIMMAMLPASASEKIPSLREQLAVSGGSLTVLSQPLSSNLDRWGPLPDSFPVMQRLKERFDPQRTLNPGCFLGGI
ncbi:FAD-binding oxidoreductase [Granulicella arctica]|uniref:FAD-binding oxidoreductase n=1 Tax=Granulicella arctica TaxID=940613 RepID=UPI0021DFB6B6|nr:FAD-binding oxidoreductase [Granulicella arctica]